MMMNFSFTRHATATHDIGSVEYARHVAGPTGKASMTCTGIDDFKPVLSAMGFSTTTDLPYKAIAKLVLPAGKMTDPAAALPLAEWVITPAAFQRIAPKLAVFISKEPDDISQIDSYSKWLVLVERFHAEADEATLGECELHPEDFFRAEGLNDTEPAQAPNPKIYTAEELPLVAWPDTTFKTTVALHGVNTTAVLWGDVCDATTRAPTGAVLLYDIAGLCLAAADRHNFQPWTRHFGTLAMAFHASGSANPATPSRALFLFWNVGSITGGDRFF